MNEGMVARLRGIQAGEIEPTAQDLNFYTHELREFVRYRSLGLEAGLPDAPPAGWQAPAGSNFRTEVWRNAHSATLDDYGLPLRPAENESLLYHPSVREVR